MPPRGASGIANVGGRSSAVSAAFTADVSVAAPARRTVRSAVAASPMRALSAVSCWVIAVRRSSAPSRRSTSSRARVNATRRPASSVRNRRCSAKRSARRSSSSPRLRDPPAKGVSPAASRPRSSISIESALTRSCSVVASPSRRASSRAIRSALAARARKPLRSSFNASRNSSCRAEIRSLFEARRNSSLSSASSPSRTSAASRSSRSVRATSKRASRRASSPPSP